METKVLENKKEKFNFREKIDYFSDHITTLTHVLVVWFTYYTWYIAIVANGWNLGTLSLHATLYVTGWTFLMLEGIMSISPNNLVSRHVSHDNRSLIHTFLQIMSAAFCLAGFFVFYLNTSRHFRSIHSKTGLASLIMTLPSFINGFSALFSVQLKKYISPGTNKVLHSVCGIATFVVGTVSLYYGLEKSWIRFKVSSDMIIFMKGKIHDSLNKVNKIQGVIKKLIEKHHLKVQ